jgi:hypothetical protein
MAGSGRLVAQANAAPELIPVVHIYPNSTGLLLH